MKNLTFIALASLLTACSSTPKIDSIKYSNSGTRCPEIPENLRWKTVADDPRWRDAFISSLLGVKDVDRLITGGTQVTTFVYDWNGYGAKETKDQNNAIVSVVDIETGCDISTKEYNDRRFFYRFMTDAPGYKYRQYLNQINSK